jgi:hypothetical protein
MMNEDNNAEIEIDDDALALAAGGLSTNVLDPINLPNLHNVNSTLHY